MKLNRIAIHNVLGCRQLAANTVAPVVLFCGDNEAGKTSIVDAIRLAFTGEPTRVDLKKQYPLLVSTGAKSGDVSVQWNGGAASASLPDGKRTLTGDQLHSALPYVLDMERFSHLEPDPRREFLFSLLSVKTGGDEVKAKLTARGCNEKKVEEILPHLKSGFEAACNVAKEKAKEGKGGFKTLTGETWGKDKGGTWQPAPLAVDADKASSLLANANSKCQATEAELDGAQQELGAARATLLRIQQGNARRADLETKSSMIGRIQAKLEIDEQQLQDMEQKLADTKAKAGAKPNPKAPGEFLLRGLASVTSDFLTLTCEYPDVEWPADLVNRAAAHIGEYKKLHGEPTSDVEQTDPEAAAKVPEYEQAVALLQSSVANGKRDLEAAKQAAATLKELEAPGESVDVATVDAKVSEIRGRLSGWKADADKYRTISAEYERRATLIKDVAAKHADIQEWTALADALAPDGIQSEMLAQSLKPINDRLRQAADDTGWNHVEIDADMAITYAGMPYGLLSKSGKWRVNAMLTESISHLSGLRFFVLDGMDILGLSGRSQALGWLSILAENNEVDTVLAFATLKAIPAGLPMCFQSHWIEAGSLVEYSEAA